MFTSARLVRECLTKFRPWALIRGASHRQPRSRFPIDFAIEEKLDAVLFAGDVVESTNSRFEAMRPLEEGIRRLLKAGIQVIAVAGNHDVEALPRLAALIDGFTLLGAGGQWEAKMITKNQMTGPEPCGQGSLDRNQVVFFTFHSLFSAL